MTLATLNQLRRSAYASTYWTARQTMALAHAHVAACLTAQPETKRQQSREVFVLSSILSNNPYLHLPSLRLIQESRGYALIMASPAGQRRGCRTLGIIHCVTGAVRPQQKGSTVDEDTGRAPLPAQHWHSDLFLCPFLPSRPPLNFCSFWKSKAALRRLV